MTDFQKMELLKKLENLVAFQSDRLKSGDWDDYDLISVEIEKLEKKIVFG